MGAPQIIPVGRVPTVHIKQVDGNLVLSGWDRPELQVTGSRTEEVTVLAETETVEIRSERNCFIQAPLQARVHIERLDGDATISMLLGAIDIGGVEGSLSASNVGTLVIGNVEGNMTVRAVAGGLQVGNVEGNVRVAQVAGDVHLGAVAGNLVASEVAGNFEAQTDGDARLIFNLIAGQHVHVDADGNIACQVQADAGVDAHLQADGKIRVNNLGEPRQASNTTLAFKVGDGRATVNLKADGNINLSGADVQPFGAEISEEMSQRSDELSQQITSQVEMQMGTLTRELEEKFSRMGNNEEMAQKIQERVSSALRKAEEKLAEAMRKMEVRTQETNQRTADADGRRRKGYAWQAPPPPPAPPSPMPPKRPQATDEERMVILRMVEQGKVSVEQAEKLLAALNG